MNMNTRKMLKSAVKVCDLLKVMAHPHRMVILCYLVDGEKSVGELAEYLGIRDSSVSQSLALLRRSNVVSARRDGQVMWYSLKSGEVRAMLETVYRLYCEPDPICGAPARPKPKTKKGK